MIRFILAGLLAFALASVSSAAITKHRMIILADMGNEPDEMQQNIHLLMYSNEVDIEGLIAVTGFWLTNSVRPDLYQDLVNGYEGIYSNLQQHASGWPTPSYLRSIIGEGYPDFGMNGVGSGKSTSGSDLIIAALNKNDPRPINIVINAGSSCLAQALLDYESRYPAQLNTAISKLLVFENGSQDDAGSWIVHRYPAIHWIRSNWQTYAYMGRSDNVPGYSNNPNPSSDGPYTWQPYPRGSVAGGDIGIGQKTWSHVHIRDNHGALGAKYPDRTAEGQFLEGGGTTPWLGLVFHGVYDPAPGHESWGGFSGRFTKDKVQNYWSRFQQIKPTEQSRDNPFYMYADQVWDSWANPEDGESFNDINCGAYRWRRATTSDFRGRMDWCTESYSQANHNPKAVFNGDAADSIIIMTASPGQVISLNASASTDPDGNSLQYFWFIYPEAGTYTGSISVPNNSSAQTTVTIPANAAGKQIHLILQVNDVSNITDESGVLKMYDFRRIVINVIDIPNNPPTVATPASASPSTVTGTTTSLSVLGADDGGEANLLYAWTTTGTPPAAVTFSPNGTNAAKASTATFIKAGTYGFQVAIQDRYGRSVLSNANVTVTQTSTSVVVGPASATVAPSATQQFTASARDQFGIALSSQPAFAWTVSGGGTINPSGLFTAGSTTGGPYTVTATGGGKSGTASVTVSTAPAGTCRIRAQNSAAGGIMRLRINDVEVASWTVGTTAADFTKTGLSGSANVKVFFDDNAGDLTVDYITINGTTTKQGEAQATNTAIWNGSACVTGQSAKIDCNGYIDFGICDFGGGSTNAAPTVAAAAAASPSTVTGTTSALSVLGADDAGETALVYTWAATTVPGGASVTFSANGTNAAKASTATFNRAGSYTLQCTIRDVPGLTATSNVNVTVGQTLTTVTVSPASISVATSGTQQFSAAAADQFGQSMAASYSWTVSGGGTINPSGLFTAGTTAGGPYTVTATSGSKNGTASVTVTSTPPSNGTCLIRAQNSAAGGIMRLRINDVEVASWTVGTTASNFTKTGLSGSSNVKVAFDDNVGDLTVDYIVINGTATLQGENQINGNSAIWTGVCGTGTSAKIDCNGYINFGTQNFGGGSTNAAPTVVTAAAANPGSVVTGSTSALSVLGADDAGEAGLSYQWAATTVPSGGTVTFSANGTNASKNVTATFNGAGSYTLRCTITDVPGLTATSSVSVSVTGGGATTTINDQTAGTGNNQFEYVGTWYSESQSGAYNNDGHWAAGNGTDYYQVRFNGTKIAVYTKKGNNHGIVAMSIDGAAETLVDLYSASTQQQVNVWTSATLSASQHTFKCRNTGTKNASSSWTGAYADRVDVTQ